MSKFHYDGHMIKQDWLDRLTLKEIQNANKKEKFNSKFFFMTIEFAIIKCEDVKYKVLYYEEVSDFDGGNLYIYLSIKRNGVYIFLNFFVRINLSLSLSLIDYLFTSMSILKR